MSVVMPVPRANLPGESQRLGATMVMSLLLHALLVLGVGFTLQKAAPVAPTLDVILSRTSTALTPKQADFLAQVANQGGGEHDKASRPRDDQIGMVPQDQPGVAPRALRAQSPTPEPATQAKVITSTAADMPVHAAATPTPPSDVPLPNGREKVERDMAMARLAAEYQLQSEAYGKRPKRKFVSASTREYAYADYLQKWVRRAERVGNLNYPDEARRRAIGGVVVIEVALRRDGSIESTRIVQSSRIPMLDQAALRIVKLAEPFPPLPRNAENVDVLHITRTWQFLPRGEMIDR